MIKFNNVYEEAAYKIRIYFKNLCDKHGLYSDLDWYKFETSYMNTYEKYDYLMTSKKGIRDGFTRHIISINFRSGDFEEYILEGQKLQNLLEAKDVDNDNNVIIYINSTPTGTYIWNINDMMSKYNIENKVMNKKSLESTKRKKSKRVMFLKKEDATFIDYKWEEKYLLDHWRELQKIEDSKKVKTKENFNDWFFDKNK